MIINYINVEGNFSQLETMVDTKWESKVEKIGITWFERKSIEKEIIKENAKEEVVATQAEFDEVAAKQFLKDKGVRGYGLLKGEGLKKRAIEEGFIIN